MLHPDVPADRVADRAAILMGVDRHDERIWSQLYDSAVAATFMEHRLVVCLQRTINNSMRVNPSGLLATVNTHIELGPRLYRLERSDFGVGEHDPPSTVLAIEGDIVEVVDISNVEYVSDNNDANIDDNEHEWDN
jgi:hypothetical protein